MKDQGRGDRYRLRWRNHQHHLLLVCKWEPLRQKTTQNLRKGQDSRRGCSGSRVLDNFLKSVMENLLNKQSPRTREPDADLCMFSLNCRSLGRARRSCRRANGFSQPRNCKALPRRALLPKPHPRLRPVLWLGAAELPGPEGNKLPFLK